MLVEETSESSGANEVQMNNYVEKSSFKKVVLRDINSMTLLNTEQGNSLFVVTRILKKGKFIVFLESRKNYT